MIVGLLVLSVLLGVLLGKFFGNNEKVAKILLIVSAGFLISICVVEVFPQVYKVEDENIGLWIVYGHFHYERCNILPVGLILGMFIHAFIEGIPLAREYDEHSSYLLGILVHNLPISFVLGAFLLREKKNKIVALITILFFAAASPLGMLLGEHMNPKWNSYFLALSGGIFLHISSVIIFESNKNHKMDWEKILIVILGVFIGILGHIFHEH